MRGLIGILRGMLFVGVKKEAFKSNHCGWNLSYAITSRKRSVGRSAERHCSQSMLRISCEPLGPWVVVVVGGGGGLPVCMCVPEAGSTVTLQCTSILGQGGVGGGGRQCG